MSCDLLKSSTQLARTQKMDGRRWRVIWLRDDSENTLSPLAYHNREARERPAGRPRNIFTLYCVPELPLLCFDN